MEREDYVRLPHLMPAPPPRDITEAVRDTVTLRPDAPRNRVGRSQTAMYVL